MTENFLIPSFHQIPYPILLQRIDSGSQGLYELSHLLHERMETEDAVVNFTTKISRSNLFQHEIQTSSSERLLGFFKNYHLYVSKALIKQQKEFKDGIVKELDQLKADRASKINKHKASVQNLLNDMALAEDALKKAKKVHTKAKSDYLRAQQKLAGLEKSVLENQRQQEERKKENIPKEGSNRFSVGRMFSAFESTPEQERDRCFMKVLKRSDEMNNAFQNILVKRKRLMELIELLDIAYNKSTSVYQKLEEERMSKLKDSMKKFVEIERANLEVRREQLQILEEAVTSQHTESDIVLFISQAKNTENIHRYGSAMQLMDEYMFMHKQGLDAANYTEHPLEAIDLQIEEVAIMKPTNQTIESSEHQPQPQQPAAEQDNNHSLKSNYPISQDNALTKPPPPPLTTAESLTVLPVIRKLSKEQHVRMKLTHPLEEPIIEDDDEYKEEEEDVPEQREDRSSFLTTEPPHSEEDNNGEQSLTESLLDAAEASEKEKDDDNDDEEDEEKEQQRAEDVALTQLDDLMAQLFDAQVLARELTVEDWSALLGSSSLRERFLYHLNQQRCHQAFVPISTYHSLTHAMEALLDFEMENLESVTNAMNISNMANTFHTSDEIPNEEEEEEKGIISTPTTSNVIKKYILNEEKIHHHPIWRRDGFWEQALKENVLHEYSKTNMNVFWDQLSPEVLKETVIGLHNTIFGQLGTLSFAMIQLGYTQEEVITQIQVMAHKFQLTEEQTYELIGNINGQKVKEYLPLTVVYTVTSPPAVSSHNQHPPPSTTMLPSSPEPMTGITINSISSPPPPPPPEGCDGDFLHPQSTTTATTAGATTRSRNNSTTNSRPADQSLSLSTATAPLVSLSVPQPNEATAVTTNNVGLAANTSAKSSSSSSFFSKFTSSSIRRKASPAPTNITVTDTPNTTPNTAVSSLPASATSTPDNNSSVPVASSSSSSSLLSNNSRTKSFLGFGKSLSVPSIPIIPVVVSVLPSSSSSATATTSTIPGSPHQYLTMTSLHTNNTHHTTEDSDLHHSSSSNNKAVQDDDIEETKEKEDDGDGDYGAIEQDDYAVL